jgi:hypothetical protein
MTDEEDVRRRREFRSLRKLMDKSATLDQFDRKMHGASATQARLFTQYKEAQRERRETKGVRSYSFVRKGKRVKVFRDRRGRFVKG